MTAIPKLIELLELKGCFVWPGWQGLMPAVLFGVIFYCYGLALFRKHSGDMVDEF